MEAIFFSSPAGERENLCRHNKQKCDISGSTRPTETIETAKYSVLNAEFRYKSAYGASFIEKLFLWRQLDPISLRVFKVAQNGFVIFKQRLFDGSILIISQQVVITVLPNKFTIATAQPPKNTLNFGFYVTVTQKRVR